MTTANTLLNPEVLEKIKSGLIPAKATIQRAEDEVLEALMIRVRYNQSKAALAYGVSRGTMRKILTDRFGTRYIGQRGD
jgi:predicted DNA-binding protein (UPF0251 family)